MNRAAIVLFVLSACGKDAPPTAAPTKPTDPSPVASAPVPAIKQGKVMSESFVSEALGVRKDVKVYLPAGYDAADERRYPVFYYLHGLGGDETNWVDYGKLDAVADKLGLEAIVVMPDGDNNFYVDSALDTKYDACLKAGEGMWNEAAPRDKTCVKASKYETYITKDLVSWVDTTYKTIPTRDARGIAGLSMGGYGALMLAMRHLDMFGAAASHSGVDALLYQGPYPYEKGKVKLFTETSAWGALLPKFGNWIRALYGTKIENWREHDPAQLATKLEPGALALYLDCGTEDEFGLNNGMQYLHDLLVERNIKHEYFIGPGRHSFEFWAPRLPNSLTFLRASLQPAK